ncbi:hypothetical protein TPA0907_00450 [Micromonospora humidisoli]|uniref:hypothetical protein n=1 Tax=unclassified Micromonospora TaxID=2617518 RepID=UPI0022BB5D58|nr:hypothetical protein [Micromonospora sp. AKA109]GHJ05678.1 hypothetical protein TPA0907_00450 [Micromonospora sp. AKA109]
MAHLSGPDDQWLRGGMTRPDPGYRAEMPMTRTPAVAAVVNAGVTGGFDTTPTPCRARPGVAATTTRPTRAGRARPR